MLILALTIALTSPIAMYQEATPDIVELNHVLRDDGTIAFSQMICYRWMALLPSRHVVSEWMMVSDSKSVCVRRIQNGYRVTWRDKKGVVFDAICYSWRETWTRHDPEVEDRKILPEDHRSPYFIRD